MTYMDARAALELWVRRIVREIGALTAVLGGVDMLAFTAGIGEHSAVLRERICAALGWLGLELDAKANAAHAATISRTRRRLTGCWRRRQPALSCPSVAGAEFRVS